MFPLQTLAFTAFFRKCGEKSETAERNSIFGNKTAGRRSLKQGSGRQFSVFHRISELPAGSMRQILESSSTPPFLRKENAGRSVVAFRCAWQVLDLPLTSEFGPCCRLHSAIESVR